MAKGGARFCSGAHRRAAQAQRKHIRRRGQRRRAEIIPIEEIYQRDRGRCSLCRKRVPAHFHSLKSYAAMPTLDHIVPLSRGGNHTRDNVQLAHHGCNSAKNNRRCGSQMRLSMEPGAPTFLAQLTGLAAAGTPQSFGRP